MKNMRSIRNAAATLIAIVTGTFTAFADAPANDNFANAEILNAARQSLVRTNVQATKEPNEPNHASNQGGKSVWFKYVPPSTGTIYITTARTSSNLNTLISVYQGTTVSNLNHIRSNNDIDGPANLRSLVRLHVRQGEAYYIAVDGYSSGGAAAEGQFRIDIHPSSQMEGADFDNDGKTDIAVFRPSEGNWYVLRSGTGEMTVQHYGTTGDIPVSATRSMEGNFPTVFRPSTGVWYGFHCCAGTVMTWGQSGDIPVAETFGGDEGAEYAVFRPSNGMWYISGHGGTDVYRHFGTAGDIPLPGRYSADSFADLVVYRPTTGDWYILQRHSNTPNDETLRVVRFGGVPGDKPVPGDYDGDGILDPAIYRPSKGTWWVLRSSDNQQHAFKWGTAEDIPTTGDFDGDGFFDFAVFRPSSGDWYIYQSSNQLVRIQHFGTTGDIPVTSNVR